MPIHIAQPQHEIAYKDLALLLARHKDLSPMEILAIAANMVGKLVAMQDQRKMTSAMALEIVANNIEIGNKHIVEQLSSAVSGNA